MKQTAHTDNKGNLTQKTKYSCSNFLNSFSTADEHPLISLRVPRGLSHVQGFSHGTGQVSSDC